MRKVLSLITALTSLSALAANPVPSQDPSQQIPDQGIQEQPVVEQPVVEQPVVEDPSTSPTPDEDEIQYTRNFNLEGCTFQNTGTSTYFDLTPGRKAIFGDESNGLEVTVLDETQEVTLPELGPIQARVIEKRKTPADTEGEVERQLVAICDKTSDVYLFGEGEGQVGLLMPGTFLIGSRYYQQFTSESDWQRAEHTKTELTEETQVGNFENCVEVTETNTTDKEEKEKVYCPGVGLVKDGDLEVSSVEGGQPIEPQVPGTPEVPEAPETPETPEIPETPETPEAPETPETPETPEVPQA